MYQSLQCKLNLYFFSLLPRLLARYRPEVGHEDLCHNYPKHQCIICQLKQILDPKSSQKEQDNLLGSYICLQFTHQDIPASSCLHSLSDRLDTNFFGHYIEYLQITTNISHLFYLCCGLIPLCYKFKQMHELNTVLLCSFSSFIICDGRLHPFQYIIISISFNYIICHSQSQSIQAFLQFMDLLTQFMDLLTQLINYIISKQMNINDRSNRSLLAMAGERSLGENLSIVNSSKLQPKSVQAVTKTEKQKQRDNRTRKLMMKLTLPRLRKMQGLVRGFLVRRKIYPQKLQQYLLAKSLLNVVISNVVYRQSSQIILQNITYLKYDPAPQKSIIGYQRILQNQICNRIAERVFHKQIVKIVQLTTAQFAKLLTRPKITYGFNLRDPLELLLFDTINNFVGMNYKEIVRQAIQQCVNQNREVRIMDEWINQYQMLMPLYQQIVEEALNESIAEYIVDNLINRMQIQGAEVVARVCYDQEIQQRQQKSYQNIERKLMEWILQQGSLKALISLGHSIDK